MSQILHELFFDYENIPILEVSWWSILIWIPPNDCVCVGGGNSPNQPEHPGILVSDTNGELKNSPSLFHKFLTVSRKGQSQQKLTKFS